MTGKLLPPISYCEEHGKPCYDKKGAITAMNKRWREDRVRLTIYPHHNHWHLTSHVDNKRNPWDVGGPRRR